MEVAEVGSGAKSRPKRETLMAAARARTIDVVAVAKLDRWGRSLADLVATMQELTELGVGFVSVSDSLDLTTAAGKALAGMLSVFAAFERDLIIERVRSRPEPRQAPRYAAQRQGDWPTIGSSIAFRRSPRSALPGLEHAGDCDQDGIELRLRSPSPRKPHTVARQGAKAPNRWRARGWAVGLMPLI